jgi:hypothetical protein
MQDLFLSPFDVVGELQVEDRRDALCVFQEGLGFRPPRGEQLPGGGGSPATDVQTLRRGQRGGGRLPQ